MLVSNQMSLEAAALCQLEWISIQNFLSNRVNLEKELNDDKKPKHLH